MIFKTQQEGRREDPWEAADASAQVSVATFLEVLESNHYTHQKQKMFSPPYATTGGGVPDKSTQFSGFGFCF